jgi:REP element-mobilizing transposase RayT
VDVSKDHLHILLSAPLHLPVSSIVQRLKGKTSRRVLSEYRKHARELAAVICGPMRRRATLE